MVLDKRTSRMLAALLRLCADGSYKIIEIAELKKQMLPRYKVETDAVAQIIRHLAGGEFIDVKYSDENVYCIAVLPKGRVLQETGRPTRGAKLPVWAAALLFAGCFVAAFLGALAAVFILR